MSMPSLIANASAARYPLQLGRLEQCEESFLLKETTRVASHSQLYSWVDWSNVGRALAQGNNNNKQHHLGIEPGSSGSQVNPKPLHAAAPLKGLSTL